ncbi:hypothetical protein BCL80_103601 [Streptomyces avidinii]|nr:hypothetical protein BCL80_103601 [Streptomyces avidinii]SNX77046.1 hypothetical protein SAMN05421860_103601 [Streptomyces microflavus]
MEIAENAALVVVDVQQGFEEEAYWGRVTIRRRTGTSHG